MKRRRGSAVLEGALVMTAFVILMVGAIDFQPSRLYLQLHLLRRHQAARYASTNGGASGHAASITNIKTNVQNNLVGLNSAWLTVTVTWSPDNKSRPPVGRWWCPIASTRC